MLLSEGVTENVDVTSTVKVDVWECDTVEVADEDGIVVADAEIDVEGLEDCD